MPKEIESRNFKKTKESYKKTCTVKEPFEQMIKFNVDHCLMYNNFEKFKPNSFTCIEDFYALKKKMGDWELFVYIASAPPPFFFNANASMYKMI